MQINNLSVYWNSGGSNKTYAGLDAAAFTSAMRAGIPGDGVELDYAYVLRPISVDGKLIVCQKPELQSYSVPKLFLNIDVDRIQMELAKSQYNQLLQLADSFDRMTVSEPYRKW